MNDRDPLLELADVSVRRGDHEVLAGIDLRIDPGERLAVVGANGSGKTTLGRLLSGELEPSAGVISGSCRRPDDVATTMEMAGESRERTVADFFGNRFDDDRIGRLLASVGLAADLGNRQISELSGGERYRVALAVQLAHNPPLLLLDAPTARLDARSTAGVVRALADRRGAVVVLSADPTLAVEVCRRAVLLAEGRIVAEGTPAELLTDAELLRRHGLDLASAVSPSWLRRRARRHREGAIPSRSRLEASWAQTERPADEAVAVELATRIEQAFVAFHSEFCGISRRAARRFAFREFAEHQADAAERLVLHRRCVESCVGAVQPLVADLDEAERRSVWLQARQLFAQAIAWRADSELAETFFNSVTRRVFTVVGIDDDLEFRWFGGIALPVVDPGQGEVATFRRRGTTRELVEAILARYDLRAPWRDLPGDAARVADAIDEHLEATWESAMPVEVDMVEPVFYRNRGAYLVGRIRHLNRVSPLVIALRSLPDGIACDAVLLTENHTSRIFGFTRSYFHVDTQEPAAVIAFVKSLIPIKPVAELYTAVGHSGHGKTSLFRALYRHLDNSTDRFGPARGVKGMVMIVFTLPSFGVVFKVIRDTFPASKRTSRTQVMDKYRLVFAHDRVGRMVDAQVFENLTFSKERFTDELLEELAAEASLTVTITDTQVIFDHVYTERRMYPLDLYLREMPAEAARKAAVDYGDAIKDLCAANIFPGDLFTKNFGVTRHGSVIFYDYDELMLLSEVNFRDIPPSRDYDDEMAAEPWFPVGPDDVFPEEFRRFFRFPDGVGEAFFARHDDLCTPDAWRALQRLHTREAVPEFFPYPDEVRLYVE